MTTESLPFTIKFCGFRRPIDLDVVATLPVQAVGFVFHPPSPRYLTPTQQKELRSLIRALPQEKVGVFVDTLPSEIDRISRALGLNTLQLYSEKAIAVLQKDWPVIRCYRIGRASECRTIPPPAQTERLLLDAQHPSLAGGTGEAFDWNGLASFRWMKRTLIAGGIHAGNVDQLLAQCRPAGIDVSSGIETAPGEKSVEKMKQIIAVIRNNRREEK